VIEKTKAACGTYGGYQRHHRRGEKPCDPCRDAATAYNRDRRKRLPHSYRREYAYAKAQTRAAWRLVDRHRDEFRELVKEELEWPKPE
jgi:hypothetical protein